MATACREKAERIAPNAAFVGPADMRAFTSLIGLEDRVSPEVALQGSSYGIVPIATGCLGSCAYCITKLARGGLRSRPVEKVVGSVRTLVSRGPREIQLTAQDTASYGSDIGRNLHGLVGEICAIDADFRLRIGMMNPRTALPMTDALGRMYQHPKVFKFLHLPVQSGSDRLLESMDRGYTVADFEDIVNAIRKVVPGMSLSTDLIVGYPGETSEDHELNLKVIASTRPDIVNVTKFSPRPRTKALDQGPAVVGWKAKDRSREISEIRFKVALENNRAWVGREARALATERGKGKSTILRTDEYKQVVVPEVLTLGKYFDVRIRRATATYLVGSRTGIR
jgi:MiaB-like tRNA modifying enzyme